MPDDSLDPAALQRLRTTIAVVLSGLFVVSLTAAVAGWWPTPWLDLQAEQWLGHSSWKVRIVGCFVVFGGGFLLPVLLVMALVAALVRSLLTES